MKNDDQMYQSVLSRRAAYRQTQENRRRTIRRITPVFACACLAVVLGVGYWNHFRNMPTIPTLPDSSQALTTETTAETGSTEVPASESTEFTSTAATVPTETEPAATADTLLPTDATEPETTEGSAPESSAEASQQEQFHADSSVAEQSQPDTQPPTVQHTPQETTTESPVTAETTAPSVVEDETVFDEPPPHLLYAYARFGEEQRIYKTVGLEVGEKELGDCLGEAEMYDGWSGTHRLTVKAYLVKERSAEDCIAVYFPETGYYLYQITNEIPDYLQRS